MRQRYLILKKICTNTKAIINKLYMKFAKKTFLCGNLFLIGIKK